MDEGEIPGCLWSSSSSPSDDNMRKSESWSNLMLLVKAHAQDVDFGKEDAVSVTGTNSNSKLQSDSLLEFMAEQLPPLDSALEHEITKSKSPMYAAVDSSKVSNCSNSNDLVPLPLNCASSFLVPLPMPPVDFVSEQELPYAALNQEFNVVNNTQFQPPIASTNGVTSYHNFADEFVSLQLNSTVTSAVSSVESYSSVPLPIVAANQVNQQFNVVNNTQSQPPIANSNVFQFTAKIIENSDEAKRQRRKQANLKSARQSRKRRQDMMKNTEKEVEHLKEIASESSLACSERKEKCDTSHRWNRVAIMDHVAIIARVYASEKQVMRVTGFHPLDDPYFISIAENAGLNLSDVRSLIHAPTYLTSPIPPCLNQLVSTFSNAPHPQRQQVQNQNFLNTGLHGAMPGWDNNQ
nr:hypothetical protein CFP56_63241 [Quercus suber]